MRSRGDGAVRAKGGGSGPGRQPSRGRSRGGGSGAGNAVSPASRRTVRSPEGPRGGAMDSWKKAGKGGQELRGAATGAQRPAGRPTGSGARVVSMDRRRQPAAAPRKTESRDRRPCGPVRLNTLGYTIGGLSLVLSLYGMLMIYSASSNLSFIKYGNGFQFLERQVLAGAVGLLFMLGLSRIDYHRLGDYSPLLMGVGLLLLVLVLFPSFGYVANGSRRFLRFGVQPSEFVKVAMLLFAAQQFGRGDRDVRNLVDLALPTLAVAALVGLLIMLEPDMGTTVIIMVAVLAMAVVAGARWSHLFSMLSLAGLLGVGLILVEPYRYQRLFSFLHPWEDPQGGGFHLIQSMLAIGSGGIGGFNLGMSRQKFMYLPNAHNDFIFSIIGEELGFIGTIFVIALFTALVLAGVKAARRAPDRKGQLLAMGITVLVGVQAFVNMGAVSGILPITGVTLPLISYGGSSLVIFLSMLGILMNVAAQGTRGAGRNLSGSEESDDSSHMRRRNGRASLSPARPERGAGVA
jgi:cell division protein FtsW